MKISIEQYGVKVTIEVDNDDQTIFELLEQFKSVALALTYQEESWKDAVMEMAELYREEEEGYDEYTDNVPEELPEPIHVRSEHC